MRSSLKGARLGEVQRTVVASTEQKEKLDSFLGDASPSALDWSGVLSGLRNAGAVVNLYNGEAFVTLGGRYILVPKPNGALVADIELAFLRLALAPAAPNKFASQDTEQGLPELRVVAAIDNRAVRIFRVIVVPDAQGFVALEPYDRFLYQRCHYPATATAVELECTYFEVLSMALAPVRKILLVERGVSTAGQRLLRFLRKHHAPIAARLVGGAVFGAPGGADRVLLSLARKYFGDS